jgi:quercetin dioxygenase-like cupin family protein
VEIELKKPGDPNKRGETPLDPVKTDPKTYKVEFENSQVRVMRVNFAAHSSTPTHEHMLNRVVVYLSDQNGRMTTPDGKTDTAVHKAGDISLAGPVRHWEENLMDTPFKGVVVELKD